jgi:RNA 2',3'-cyclic 3'-phosphodiesterase
VIRAFIAVRIDPAVTERIAEARSQLEPSLKGIRWVKEDNLHLTLKFLGPVAEDKIAPIAEALEKALRSMERFSVGCRGLGVFPDIRKPRVLWAGLQGGALGRLAAAVEEVLASIGLAREEREFKPHLTIGRWRDFTARPDALRSEMERWREHDFGRSEMNEVIFFQSVLKPGGAVHTPLGIFPLAEKQKSD